MAITLARPRKQNDDSRIDLTPMLDVVFILLIFFVVTAIVFQESSLPLASQPPSPKQPLADDTPDNILVVIGNDNRLTFNGDSVEAHAVRARIAMVRARNPQAAAIIRAAPNSRADVLVRIANDARLAGVENIQVSE